MSFPKYISRYRASWRGRSLLLTIAGGLLWLWMAEAGNADIYLSGQVVTADDQKIVGQASHHLEFGQKISVFLPPFTVHCTIFPLSESLFSVELEFYELAPGFSHRAFSKPLARREEIDIDSLKVRDRFFDYRFWIHSDTLKRFAAQNIDSLLNDESIHFRAWIVPGSYANFKWPAREKYLEEYFDLFRKRLKITRSGKIDCYIFDSPHLSSAIDLKSGLGFDIPSGKLYAVYSSQLDSALPENMERFIIYQTWGYSADCLVVGLARYFLDDPVRLKEVDDILHLRRVKESLLRQAAVDSLADMVAGAFVKYLIDTYGIGAFRALYEKSTPGRLATQEALGVSFDDLLKSFLSWVRQVKLDEATAVYYSSAFRSQHWFARALPYDRFLAQLSAGGQKYLRRLATCLFYLGYYAESESVYAEAAAQRPGDLEALFLWAIAQLRAGKYAAAVRHLHELGPKFRSAAKMNAELALDKGQLDSARFWLNSIAGFPDCWTAMSKARLALAEGDTATARVCLSAGRQHAQQTIATAGDEARGYIDMGYLELLAGNFDTALTWFSTAVLLDNRPFYRGLAWLGLGRVYDLMQQRAMAEECYRLVLSNNSGEYTSDLARRYLVSRFGIR